MGLFGKSKKVAVRLGGLTKGATGRHGLKLDTLFCYNVRQNVGAVVVEQN